MAIEKNNIDSAIAAGVAKFKELNPFPADLHSRIMEKLNENDNADKAVAAGVSKFTEANPYPVDLHGRIMGKLDEKRVFRISWPVLIPRAAVALALLFVVIFAGSKIIESQRPQVNYQIPVAVVLSLESQAGLIKPEKNGAFEDSINSVIFNMEQEGS